MVSRIGCLRSNSIDSAAVCIWSSCVHNKGPTKEVARFASVEVGTHCSVLRYRWSLYGPHSNLNCDVLKVENLGRLFSRFTQFCRAGLIGTQSAQRVMPSCACHNIVMAKEGRSVYGQYRPEQEIHADRGKACDADALDTHTILIRASAARPRLRRDVARALRRSVSTRSQAPEERKGRADKHRG